MSFLFKSSKKGAPAQPTPAPAPAPPATRNIHSSDGKEALSQIPTLNGAKPGSPTPGQSVNNSINSISGDRSGSRQAEDRVASIREDGPRTRASPEQKSLRNRSRETSRDVVQRLPMQQQLRPSTDNSPYPWSQRRLNFTVTHVNPFPRYGAAVNGSASKDGSVYLMGGLINGSTVKGDLWMVEAGTQQMSCYPVATTSEGPGPRVGHASLLVGNAYIVFGGDTKMDEGDMLDDTLYLLNTSTKQWSRALPAGPRPPGRYGHTLNILGSKIYIFGGQVEGYFFNDLVAFDLNALQQATNRWEILIQNTIDGGPPHGQIPPARTNHTMITYGDRLYLFGGTDGVQWFNDVWSYSPQSNSWTQLECIGYIPSPREGHAAALVGDVMYVFGGRTEEGNDLGDLAAFRISSRRWYTFQNMGPSPSPRSGHSMTTVGKSIVVLAGEPSSAPRDPVELGMAYFLDTSKIRYPPDSTTQTPNNERIQDVRRPSGERPSPSIGQGRGTPAKELMERERAPSGAEGRIRSPDMATRLPRAANQIPPPTGPPPQAPLQSRANGAPGDNRQLTSRTSDRALSPENDRPRANDANNGAASQAVNGVVAPQAGKSTMSPPWGARQGQPFQEPQSEPQSRSQPATYQPSQDNSSRTQTQPSELAGTELGSRQPVENVDPVSRVRKISEEPERPQDSGLGSSPAFAQQNDGLIRELEQVKQRNAWYASELALARKSGYQSRAPDSPSVDERSTESFSDADRPLVEALLKMRAELAKVQETIDEQSRSAATRIAETEKERDAAINEAVFAKARLASQGTQSIDGDSRSERGEDMSKRLVASIQTQNELKGRIGVLEKELEAESKARELAEDTASAAQKRASELDAYRQEHTSEIETLRSELHESQRQAREASASHAEILTQHRMLSVDKEELSRQLDGATSDSSNHMSILASLREAVTASSEKADMLEQKLAEERSQRDALHRDLQELRSQKEAQASELQHATTRLKDAEELAQKHSEEARTHRSVVLAGFGKIPERSVDVGNSDNERINILTQQVEAANAMVRENQAAADAASEKLRRAEERIAGLETYQEQASREGLNIRKQLQATMKENQGLATEKAGLEQRLERHMLETNALSVQHASLKDILGERGVNINEARRSRGIDSPSSARFSTPDLHRVRELEQQLETTTKGQDELREKYEEVSEQGEKMKREYEEKLTALDNDHQAAVKYLRGTEKMLSKMKQELQRVKNDNGELKRKLDQAMEESAQSKRNTPDSSGSGNWESERAKLQQEVSEVQNKMQTSVNDLETKLTALQSELQTARSSHSNAQSDLTALQTSFTSSRSDIERLQKENSALEARARDAENKVQLLLDQVESSVDNYRRQSRLTDMGTPTLNGAGASPFRHRPESISEASEAETPVKAPAGNFSHSRDTSNAASSIAASDTRNSLALDSLASELDALRSHWETTNKNYRLSDRYDFDGHSGTASPAKGAAPSRSNAPGGASSSLADWRRGLQSDDDDDQRPSTAEGPKPSSSNREANEIEDDLPTPTAADRASRLMTGN
ncbi:cell polarity protein (Tea1) [Zymoseptoria brevis]|uniref:Cell polarity protein (Tea1) n=1 Tax=Zymoseptoria brevis TaxID=1047168 RepID=A0A0F4GGZ4_9PEZI|nr:cell polarity protein (Tea1) [Zymoseptoria brevis]